MAMKILGLRVSDGLHVTFKYYQSTNEITRAHIEDRNFIEKSEEMNLSFLMSIPNSAQYWATRKKDLFAMIRQLGKLTMFLTMSANEIRWTMLLKILHKMNITNNAAADQASDIEDPMRESNGVQRATLVVDDPVTCCIYFNKLVDVIMRILSYVKSRLFGQYCVVDYFKSIEFKQRGSPNAHILLWLKNDPREEVSVNMPQTLKLIESLCSVSAQDLPDTYSLQVHKHMFTCYKKTEDRCRFNIPY